MILLYIIGAVVVLLGFMVFFGAPYVPSHKKYVRRAFQNLYEVTDKDVVVDIGSGDGVVLRAAAQQGAKAIGYEINPLLVVLSRLLSTRYKKVSVQLRNFWVTKLPEDVTLVYMFGVERDNTRLISFMREEANRLGRPLSLMVHGNPLKAMTPDKTYEAYALYVFHPLQAKKVTV